MGNLTDLEIRNLMNTAERFDARSDSGPDSRVEERDSYAVVTHAPKQYSLPSAREQTVHIILKMYPLKTESEFLVSKPNHSSRSFSLSLAQSLVMRYPACGKCTAISPRSGSRRNSEMRSALRKATLPRKPSTP